MIAYRDFANIPFIHGATTPTFQPDATRFVDRAQEIDYAHQRAENEVGGRLPRPSWYKAAVARAKSASMRGEGPKEVFDLAKTMDNPRGT